MAYNATSEALKKMRSRKTSMDDFHSGPELEAGLEDLPENLQLATDLAPEVKKEDQRQEQNYEMNEEEQEEMQPNPNPQVRMQMQKQNMDQGDAVLPEGMYEPGDENKKGFMGKAAMLMKKKLGR